MYFDELITPFGKLLLIANTTAITSIRFTTATHNLSSNALLLEAKQQLLEYCHGKRHTFSLPLAPQGTAFQQAVWQQLQSIRYGATESYQTVATALNVPNAYRAVGAANARNPIAIIIPCHRVIGKNGQLTGYAGGLERKQQLLDLERANRSNSFSLNQQSKVSHAS
ncbi:MAG: methylated-DNA--[protein]-cysteine S-methyltransferase [Gammaproteobacteria bacterium]|nr:methylated-DNA--[protein]-cysteine S-methyltransferase [Gammaproteobacteria bacterium]